MHLWWKTYHQNVNFLSLWANRISITTKTMAALAWDARREWSRCSSLALTAARKTTLNSDSESCGGLEQHPGRRAGWVTSLPSSNGLCVLENNGRNHILPSCPESQGFSDKCEQQRYRRLGLFLQLWGPRSPCSCRLLHLPDSSYWTSAYWRSCESQISQL